MVISDQVIYQSLSELELIPQQELDRVYKESQENKQPLGQLLVNRELISDDVLGKVVADLLQLPFVILAQIVIPETILRVIPESMARKLLVVSFAKQGTELQVASPHIIPPEIIQSLQKKSECTVKQFYATERDVQNAFRFYKKDLQRTFDEMLQEAAQEAKNARDTDLSINNIVNLVVEYGFHDKASDIHIEPKKNSSLIRFRIDGVLHDVLHLPRELHDHIVSKIKVLSRLRTDEHLRAQDGKLQMSIENEDVDVRVSILPIQEGENIVLRLLSSHSRQFSLTDLGMNSKDLEKVKNGFQKPYGMVLSTGPTGSGKTTTMYAILKILNVRERSIATIEDPVEYEIEEINQIQVNAKTNLTFAEGLRSILRQDPDVIYVGEIRDPETADIAVNSALTGHLVLSTLHTNDAATSFPRLIDMNIEPFLVASTVNVIIAQRLVRKICEKCKVSFLQKTNELYKQFQQSLVDEHFGPDGEITLYHGKGCPVCHNTGYVGRIGIFEILEISDVIREMIVQKADSDMIAKQAIKEGMTTMTDDGLLKVKQGITTIEEVLRVTKE